MYNKSEIYAVIPARSGSKRIKNKNVLKFKGKSLIEYSIISAIKSQSFLRKNIILSSDDKNLKKYSEKYDITFHLRKKTFARDKTTMQTTLKNIIKECNISIDNILVLLQPTSPLRSDSIIDKSIKLLSKDKKSTSIISVIKESLFFGTIIKNKYWKPHFNSTTRTQDIKIYSPSGSIFAYKIKKSIMTKKELGNYPLAVIEDEKFLLNIDTSEDYRSLNQKYLIYRNRKKT